VRAARPGGRSRLIGFLLFSTAASPSRADPPPFLVEGAAGARESVERAAARHWDSLERLFAAVAEQPAPGRRRPIVVRTDRNPQKGEGGASTPGTVLLRLAAGRFGETESVALRHELAHQFLFQTCPALTPDALAHEAFATSTSGELPQWESGRYLSLPAARAALERDPRAESRESRRALARLLRESAPDSDGALSPESIPPAVRRRLRACADGVPQPPLVPAELAETGRAETGDALVVLNRHSGETLLARGDADAPRPFGSVLKPFVVAGALDAGREPPVLAPQPGRTEWLCGPSMPERMDWREALLRSCNGYFLDWAARDASIASQGAWGSVLVAAGMERLPADLPEAIGLRSTLRMSPAGVARAYRVLAEARPDVVEILARNSAEGTLSGLPASRALRGVALKTGTVRDAEVRPEAGWIAAVDDDFVMVMVRRGRMPRSFAGEFVQALEAARALAGSGPVRVQTFGLLPADRVEARCPNAFALGPAGPEQPRRQGGNADFAPLSDAQRHGPLLCLDGPFRVRFPGSPPGGREYAGVFSWSPPPPYESPPGEVVGARAARARRGSDFVFRTSLRLYVAGVLDAEDAAVAGSAREALARVVAHNASQARHPGRPLCDTTHCQVFPGTPAPRPGDDASLRRPVVVDGRPASGWLTFSQGGGEPWTEARPVREVEAVLGRGATSIRIGAGRVRWAATTTAAGAPVDEARDAPCEKLRGPLKLPACPAAARREGDRWVFDGRGRGHGEGLDVERAKKSPLGADELLQEAYGARAVR